MRQYLSDAGEEHIAVWPCGAYPPPGLTGTLEESPKGVRGDGIGEKKKLNSTGLDWPRTG